MHKFHEFHKYQISVICDIGVFVIWYSREFNHKKNYCQTDIHRYTDFKQISRMEKASVY